MKIVFSNLELTAAPFPSYHFLATKVTEWLTTTSTTFNSPGLVSNTNCYRYSVRAKSSAGVFSDPTPTLSFGGNCGGGSGVRPAPTLKGSKGSTSADLSWSDGCSPFCVVYRNNARLVSIENTGFSGGGYSDRTINDNTSYVYRVIGENSLGLEMSLFSNPYTQIGGLKVVSKTDKSITLAWIAPPAPNDVIGYYIYRYEPGFSDPFKLQPNPILRIGNVAGTQFTDNNVSSTGLYHYYISPVYADGSSQPVQGGNAWENVRPCQAPGVCL